MPQEAQCCEFYGAKCPNGYADFLCSIYIARNAVSTYYAFRIDGYETRLKSQQDERSKTIQKLKDATKYDSTLELIEKYGGEGKKKKKEEGDGDKPKKPKQPQHRPGRTSMPPPPTANIQRPNQPASYPSSPHPQQQQQLPGTPQGQTSNSLEPTEEFAPNAFSGSSPPQAPAGYTTMPLMPESHWYDRVFDVLLGEDETAAKNRIVLICSSCRLVNGQAPPGTTSLAQIGMWRCMACHATNNEESETKKLIEEALADAYEEDGDTEIKDDQEEDEADTSGVMVEVEGEEGSTALDKGSVRKRNTKK